MAAAPALPRARSPMRIRRVLIEEGRADFADHSVVQPNFAAGIVGLSGSVTDLSSDPDSRASVALTGSVDRYAPVDIRGEVNLLAADVFSDLALSFRNMELTTFNPYSGKFAGYNIAKGKLTTELNYVEKRRLEAQHHIVLDQLEFGAATESKDAVPLPVRLAVALLKDRTASSTSTCRSVAASMIPSSASARSSGRRCWAWCARSSPRRSRCSARCSAAVPDPADAPFAVGLAGLAPAEQEKLGQLARALTERPQLRLDIPLQTLAAADDAALAEAAFESALAAVPPGTGSCPRIPGSPRSRRCTCRGWARSRYSRHPGPAVRFRCPTLRLRSPPGRDAAAAERTSRHPSSVPRSRGRVPMPCSRRCSRAARCRRNACSSPSALRARAARRTPCAWSSSSNRSPAAFSSTGRPAALPRAAGRTPSRRCRHAGSRPTQAFARGRRELA